MRRRLAVVAALSVAIALISTISRRDPAVVRRALLVADDRPTVPLATGLGASADDIVRGGVFVGCDTASRNCSEHNNWSAVGRYRPLFRTRVIHVEISAARDALLEIFLFV
jgi:hypothetical protein